MVLTNKSKGKWSDHLHATDPPETLCTFHLFFFPCWSVLLSWRYNDAQKGAINETEIHLNPFVRWLNENRLVRHWFGFLSCKITTHASQQHSHRIWLSWTYVSLPLSLSLELNPGSTQDSYLCFLTLDSADYIIANILIKTRLLIAPLTLLGEYIVITRGPLRLYYPRKLVGRCTATA